MFRGAGLMWRAVLCAARFLTRLPLPDPGPPDGPVLGRSALFYPMVGLCIGTLVWGLCAGVGLLAQGAAAGPLAAVVLIAWVWLTGGLHLDGLADSADAWVGGLGNRARTLEILRDPRIGVMGALALGLALIAKWAGLAALIEGLGAAVLIWLSALSRGQLLLLMLTTPYARSQGLGGDVVARLPRGPAWAVLALVAGGTVLALGLVALAVAGLTFLLWRRAMLQRLGGFTGDTAGALVELTEAAVLLALAL
jgi:adenosylcobinamide-GDP ribazoletransferase